MNTEYSKLPKWARQRIYELEARVEQLEKTLPWTESGMEWFTLFKPSTDPKLRAPKTLFTCSENGTHPVCSLGPNDFVFIGRGKRDMRIESKIKMCEVLMTGKNSYITYARREDPSGARFKQLSKHDIPSWAVDVRTCEDDAPTARKVSYATDFIIPHRAT